MEISSFFARTVSDKKSIAALGVQGSFVLWREQAPFFCNVCFYYIPPALAELSATPFWELGDDAEACARIRKVAPFVKNRMQRKGDCGMLGFCGQQNLFRLIISSPIGLEDSDMLDLLVAIDREGSDFVE